jgi:hypothetical protein
MSIEQATNPSVIAAPRPMGSEVRIATDAAKRVAVCAGLLALLMVWPVIFPQTGDGDAIMHYLNAHDSLWQPAKLMGSWARVGAKIPLLIPAQFGVLGARWAAAVISIVCAWQTIRLADDLKIRRSILAAAFLIFQPFVFTLAGDTMTELPFALGMVVAIRLRLAGRLLASCLVMGYLPTVRPEGFFLCAMWAAMVIANRRPILVVALGWGVVAWFVACLILRGDPTYFFRQGWSWPADSLRAYGHGSFFSHVNRWPIYCGPVLLPLFLLGLCKSALPIGSPMGEGLVTAVEDHTAGKPAGYTGRLSRHRWVRYLLLGGIALVILEVLLPPGGIGHTVLPWPALLLIGLIAWAVRRWKFAIGVWVFLLIFTLHTVLWWRGWFGSCGLMRILACVAPITAIACLNGWNLIADQMPGMLRAGVIAGAVVTAMVYYIVDPRHQRIFPLQRACQFVARHDLLRDAPMIIFGDPMAQAALNLPPNPPNLLPNDCDRAREYAHLLHAPLGSVGLWDNQHAQAWFGVSISDLSALGYTILFQTQRRPPLSIEWLEPANPPRDQVYVVIRKDRPGRMAAASSSPALGL